MRECQGVVTQALTDSEPVNVLAVDARMGLYLRW